MRVAQVVPSIGAESSGPSYSVPAMCRGLAINGCEVSLHVLATASKRKFAIPVTYYPWHSFPARKIGRSPEMFERLKELCKTVDIIHNNSFWMLPNVYPAWAKKRTKCKLVNAPRGTLAEWSLRHHWLQKKIFGWCGQYSAMASTDMWHATCEKEYEEIRKAGYAQPVAIVPIGIDLPSLTQEVICRRKNSRIKRVVFLGRLHKVKAVDDLILAWGCIEERFPDWELVIAGPDSGLRNELENVISAKRIPRVTFAGELSGSAKFEFLASANLCVLPSHTENFGVAVVEALSCGTPVIASQGTPWRELAERKCGWWIPIGMESLAGQLQVACALGEADLQAMGIRGREWMSHEFAWESVGRKMKIAYEWLVSGGEMPEWIRVD